MSTGLLERNADKINGVLGCFDLVVITGYFTEIAHPSAMAARLFTEVTRIRHVLGKQSIKMYDK